MVEAIQSGESCSAPAALEAPAPSLSEIIQGFLRLSPAARRGVVAEVRAVLAELRATPQTLRAPLE